MRISHLEDPGSSATVSHFKIAQNTAAVNSDDNAYTSPSVALNQKESEKMMNEVIIIELVQHFKSKMKMVKKSVSLNEFIKLANNQK